MKNRVPGYPGIEVDAEGNVWRDGHIQEGRPNDHGYIMIGVGFGAAVKRCKLVLLAFEGEKPSPLHQALHRNDIKIDDNPSNLYWGLDGQNKADAWRNGIFSNRFQPRRKVTEEQCREMSDLYSQGAKQKDLAIKYGIGQAHVSRILRGVG